MKETTDMEGFSAARLGLKSERQRIDEAKDAAKVVREGFARLSTIDRAIVKRTEQYKALERLVEAVEAL